MIAANADGSATPLGLGLVLAPALAWAGGNLVAKASGARDLLPVVVWGSLFSVPPLLALSLLLEGWPAIRAGLAAADAATWARGGLADDGQLALRLRRLGLAAGAPPGREHRARCRCSSPCSASCASAWWLGEPLPAWKLVAAALVIAGLAIGVLWPRWRAAPAPRGPAPGP